MEDCQKSEKIRNRMNDNFKKSHNVNYDIFPFFTKKPSFYMEIDSFVDGDLLAPFKVQCDSTAVGLEYLKKYRVIEVEE